MREEIPKIKEVIHEFQEGYLNRDMGALEKFMDLFCDESILEVIAELKTGLTGHTASFAALY
ncbi:MAG: hypothetical protein JXA21_06595 [Anaerolineae bacterium]|nr:hypothetical protein [Anaerolineae bacterium]